MTQTNVTNLLKLQTMYPFKSPFNANRFAPLAQKRYEENTAPSLTVPDQSLSINEILKRFASGLPLGGSKVPFYQDEDDDLLGGVDPKTLDLAEKQQIKEAAKKELEEIKGRLDKKAKEKFEKETRDKVDKAAKKLFDEKYNKDNKSDSGEATGK